MTDPVNMQSSASHHFNADTKDNTRSSCCSSSPVLNVFEPHTSSPSSLENMEEEHPFSYIYLLNLFLTPDITRYLAETNMSDDVYSLPIHLQKLICEARMEVLISKQKNLPQAGNTAVKKLEKVRDYIKSVAHYDTAAIIATLNELIHDEDEMSIILES